MNPVVVMAVWGRLKLVEINLRLLSEQMKCQVVCITSLQRDHDFILNLKIPGIHVHSSPNNPLGHKWQSGVDYARELGADPLIPLGSDDFLDQNFIENGCKLAQFFDFVCFDEWYIHSPADKLDYRLRYANRFPLGGGRVFPKRFLDRIGWRLYDPNLNVKLDNYAWDNIKYDDKVLFNPQNMAILSVKGGWEVMNPLDRILSSEAISWTPEKNIDQVFKFSRPIHQIFQSCAAS